MWLFVALHIRVYKLWCHITRAFLSHAIFLLHLCLFIVFFVYIFKFSFFTIHFVYLHIVSLFCFYFSIFIFICFSWFLLILYSTSMLFRFVCFYEFEFSACLCATVCAELWNIFCMVFSILENYYLRYCCRHIFFLFLSPAVVFTSTATRQPKAGFCGGGKSTEPLWLARLIEAGILDVGIAAETMAKANGSQIINLFNTLPKRFPITRVTRVECVYSILFGVGCSLCALFSFEETCRICMFLCRYLYLHACGIFFWWLRKTL